MIGTLPVVTKACKGKITPGHVTARNLSDMAHEEFRERWREQAEPHERLRWARTYWQLRAGAYSQKASDAAKALGMNENTYRAYERAPGSSKSISLDHQSAIEFARRFQIDWHWLLLGQGTPFDNELPEPQARVVRAMAKASDVDQRSVADMIEAFLGRRAAS